MAQQVTSSVLKKKKSTFWSDNVGFLFVLPWLIGFCVFKLYPFGSSLYYSFTNYSVAKGMTQGVYNFDNYTKIFSTETYTNAMMVTFKYAFITVPLKLVVALFIAYILNFKIKGVNLFRTAYYIPSILGGSIAIAVLWKALFKDEGVINMILAAIGINGPSWLSDPSAALFIISLLRAWQFGSAMVIFLAALKGVPTELYEAASVDGAGKWRQFFSITIPLITPVIFYNLITQLCQAFQEFNGPFVITQGGPDGATTLMSLLIYKNAFTYGRMGMACSLAWVLFVILTIFTLISFISQKYWVYYDDEGR